MTCEEAGELYSDWHFQWSRRCADHDQFRYTLKDDRVAVAALEADLDSMTVNGDERFSLGTHDAEELPER